MNVRTSQRNPAWTGYINVSPSQRHPAWTGYINVSSSQRHPAWTGYINVSTSQMNLKKRKRFNTRSDARITPRKEGRREGRKEGSEEGQQNVKDWHRGEETNTNNPLRPHNQQTAQTDRQTQQGRQASVAARSRWGQ